ncbi:hypothetical protein AGDE_00612 [Angomonas deanei]|uniref:Uncharacterized protein n=1 Tax=Angomonas deanei TaxID=59799 RepID=A0A7G2CQA5_9TRYP|nr:hypothetical protein AGDE_00612 [Angomonas deanei]CAD2220372.1 hypothetical protein, conserved [Angomonas deanei]|eukprot:EPY43310.1 hypothetical protein AGDE_00612 [Angomonas deanei]
MSVSEELLLVWKEIWNVYDIIDDKIPLLPENFEGVDKCLAAIKQKNVSSVGESFQDFKLPTSLAGNNKILVATHYLSYEDKKSFVSKVNPNASAAGVAVFDLRQVPASEIHDKLARDLAWLASFASIQVDSVFFSCAAVVVLLPYAVVPSVQELEHCVHANSELAHFAKAVLEMYDFIGEYLSLVNCHSPESPPVFVLGKTETETIQKISESLSPNDNRVFVFHGDHLPAMDALPLAQATSVTVPLKQLNDGEEEAWDPSTQKEMARLNFCPCCGSCDHQH